MGEIIRAGSMRLSIIFLTFFSLAVSSLPVEDGTLDVVKNDLKDSGKVKTENANQLDDLSQPFEGPGSLPHSLKRRSPSAYIPRSWLRGEAVGVVATPHPHHALLVEVVAEVTEGEAVDEVGGELEEVEAEAAA